MSRHILPSALLSCLVLGVSAQWQSVGSGLQSVRSVTTQGNAIYAVTFPSGIKKSTDDGASWAPANNGITETSGNTFVQSVGQSSSYLFAGTQSGIYRSNDGGANWTNVNGTLTANNTVYAHKFFHFNNVLFAVFTGTIANGGGIYRTGNHGDQWLIGHSGMGSNQIVYDLAYDGTTMYAATNTGLYTSANTGQAWTAVAGANFATYAVEKVGNRLIIISSFGFRYSDNGGTTWNESTGDINNPSKGELIAFDGKIIGITGSNAGCIVSTDNGATYTDFNAGLAPVDAVSQEEFHRAGPRLYMGAALGLYRLEGTGVGIATAGQEAMPMPYPSPFTDAFQLDTDERFAAGIFVLIDAAGREVAAQRSNTSGRLRMERNGLPAGPYRLIFVDARSGERRSLGTVVAQ
jgi:photosystem II stability/assembly factor-like uncharacterized protein